MPSSHRNALKRLLAASEQQIIDAERRLLVTTDDRERAALIDTLAVLHIAHENLKAALTDDDPAFNS